MKNSESLKENPKELPFMEILDNLDTGIALFDPQGNYLFVNTAVVNWRNLSRTELLSRNVHDFLGILDICVFDIVMEKRQRISRLQYYKSARGIEPCTRTRIVTGVPIFGENANIRYVISMMNDVASFEELCRSLERHNKIVNYESSNETGNEKMDMIAQSESFCSMLAVAANVAPLDSTILLYGESGSGKEVVANFIHGHSERRDKPMITVNCAAFPENLIEAELFGYEKGAFTGANREGKAGLVETADGGTLFLDEINSLPLNVQGKLLRTLEQKSIQRIGSTKVKKVNFRLIAATNRDLNELIRQGAFREDLYYRLQVIPLTLPPIRERKEDIIPLCQYFLRYYCVKYNIEKKLSEEVLEELKAYDWPGNVREIRNFSERIVVMTPRSITEVTSIPSGLLCAGRRNEPDFEVHPAPAKIEPVSAPSEMFQKMKILEKEQILAALEICGGHREKTAEYLGISKRQLQYKIKEYHLSSRCRYDFSE